MIIGDFIRLTKENFWNDLYKKYPEEMKVFCMWIDRYKEKVGWNTLFNINSDYQNSEGKNAVAPKYHDLPIAMQVGIFFEFCMGRPQRYPLLEGTPPSMLLMAEEIKKWFAAQQMAAKVPQMSQMPQRLPENKEFDGRLPASLILYPINIESAPNFVMRQAFARHFSPFEEYDWHNLAQTTSLEIVQQRFLEILKAKRPDYCFMQLQNENNMSVSMIREMAKYTKIINWSGDIRTTQAWYDWFLAIGKEIHLTLFSNETDPAILRRWGVKADYLQVGFDTIWYNRQPNKLVGGWPEIVYCANDYGNFQLSRYRADVVLALTSQFGPRFKVFGAGWDKHQVYTHSINNVQEAQAYNNCKIAISVSNFSFERYYSDRLLRIMGCGAFPLTHHFSGIEKDFKSGYDIEVFNNIDELVSKCHYYLLKGDERQAIADNAYNTAHTQCTWEVRMKELIQALRKYE